LYFSLLQVHLANGIWGVIAVGLFASPKYMAVAGYNSEKCGLFYGCGGELLACQFAGFAFILVWVGGLMTPFFFILKLAGMLRVDRLEEEVGLDISHHRGTAYDLSGPNKEHVEELMEVRASKHASVEVPREVANAALAAKGDGEGDEVHEA
jgi:ammonium transporter, Amt family